MSLLCHIRVINFFFYSPSLAESPKVNFNTAQLAWPFDPESVTIPLTARKTFVITHIVQEDKIFSFVVASMQICPAKTFRNSKTNLKLTTYKNQLAFHQV